MTSGDGSPEPRIAEIEARNRRVESDKAWETSWTRRAVIAVSTYAVVTAYGAIIGVADPWLAAAVPAAGFLLSTLTLPPLKRAWVRRRFAGNG